MRKLILVVALVSAVSLGCGRLNEDLCALGGSFADDPSTPIGIVELALPSHSQNLHRLALPVMIAQSSVPAIAKVAPFSVVIVEYPAALPSRPTPIRC